MVLVILCVQRMVSTAMQSWTLQRVGILCLFTSFFIHPSWRTREETKTKTVWLQRNLFVVARLGLEVSVGTHFLLHLQFFSLGLHTSLFSIRSRWTKELKNKSSAFLYGSQTFQRLFFFFKETLIQLCTFQACCNASDHSVRRLCRIRQKNGCVKAAWRGQAHFVSRLQAVGRHVPRLPPAGAQNTAAHATNRCLHAPL